jgi:thiamine-phosphate pyrophosphorylase
MIEVRAKHANGAEYYEFTRLVIGSAGETCSVVVNDRLDVALAAGAAGVHLGENDLPIAAARAMAARPFIIGATCREPDYAVSSAYDGADYLGVGAVFPTGNKDDTRLIGLEGLAAVTSLVNIPVFAIAGITGDNCSQAVEAGAWGASCISAIAASADPAAAWNEMEWSMEDAAPKNR